MKNDNNIPDEITNNKDHLDSRDIQERADDSKPKVVIEVLGGIANITQAPDNIEIEIIDHDNED